MARYIIGIATTLIGLNFMSLGPYQDKLGFSVLTKEILLGVTFGGMGLICPFIIVPIIPDMHASHADALRAARHGRPPKTNEHTTNLISSLAYVKLRLQKPGSLALFVIVLFTTVRSY